MRHKSRSNPWKSCLLGGISGLAGVAAMNYFMEKTSGLVESSQGAGAASPEQKSISLVGPQRREGESATAAAGRIAYKFVTKKEPESDEMKSALSQLVHWGYGVDMGILYGLSRRNGHGPDLAGGLAFGAGLWLAGDEVAVPLLGLADPPTTHPPSMHLQALGGHLVYGAVTAVTYQALNRIL